MSHLTLLNTCRLLQILPREVSAIADTGDCRRRTAAMDSLGVHRRPLGMDHVQETLDLHERESAIAHAGVSDPRDCPRRAATGAPMKSRLVSHHSVSRLDSTNASR